MHESMSITTKEYERTERENAGGVESALASMHAEMERVEKAVAVLTDRLDPVLQPEYDEPGINAVPTDVTPPQSPVVRRICGLTADLRRVARRLDGVTTRLDT